MKHMLKTLAGMTVFAVASAFPAKADTVSMFCSATDYELCEKAVQKWTNDTGHEVKLNRMPQNLDDAIPIYQQLFAAQSSDMDVLYIDVIWLGMFKDHLLDLTSLVPENEVTAHFASAADAARLDGKLLSMPFYIDTGLMFYRKDLLEKYGKQPPKTWDELTATAKEIQDAERKAGSPDIWGYSWQGRSYEGLTCDALEWIASAGGGTILSGDGEVTINNPQTEAALTRARGWIGTISPEGVLNYDEENSRALFESGNAVFHRNWPYVWGTSQAEGGKLVGKVGVSALPVGAEGQKSSGALGTAYLGVSNIPRSRSLQRSCCAIWSARKTRRCVRSKAATIRPSRRSTRTPMCWRRSRSSAWRRPPSRNRSHVRRLRQARTITVFPAPSTGPFTTSSPARTMSPRSSPTSSAASSET